MKVWVSFSDRLTFLRFQRCDFFYMSLMHPENWRYKGMDTENDGPWKSIGKGKWFLSNMIFGGYFRFEGWFGDGIVSPAVLRGHDTIYRGLADFFNWLCLNQRHWSARGLWSTQSMGILFFLRQSDLNDFWVTQFQRAFLFGYFNHCQGLSSHYFHIIGDKLINPSP